MADTDARSAISSASNIRPNRLSTASTSSRCAIDVHPGNCAAVVSRLTPAVSPSLSTHANHLAMGTQPVDDADCAEAVTVRPVAATMASPIAGAVTTAIVLDDGTRHVLDTERITIGRQSGCSIVIRDSNVSREPVQLRRRPHGWTVRDIGSTNGTKLNGVRVEGEQTLANGDIIMLGAIKVTFEIS